jgi:hypothetical protein
MAKGFLERVTSDQLVGVPIGNIQCSEASPDYIFVWKKYIFWLKAEAVEFHANEPRRSQYVNDVPSFAYVSPSVV